VFFEWLNPDVPADETLQVQQPALDLAVVLAQAMTADAPCNTTYRRLSKVFSRCALAPGVTCIQGESISCLHYPCLAPACVDQTHSQLQTRHAPNNPLLALCTGVQIFLTGYAPCRPAHLSRHTCTQIAAILTHVLRLVTLPINL
jgi:hypothetical protein